MSRADLEGPLLAAVSRSFHLTIRLLPTALREPIALGYLLARASDTIADTADASAEIRLRHLAGLERMIVSETRDELSALQREIHPPDADEQALIANLGRCLDWLADLPPGDRDEIAKLMPKIIRGQTLDLQRFGAGGTGIIALKSAAELDEYTYLVAGCVGEFWTAVCAQKLPHFAALDVASLNSIGASYGKGLQLVNILRDMPADLRSGRCYLPADELLAAGLQPTDLLTRPHDARGVVDHWLDIAATRLDDGRRYIEALKHRRVRVGCFLPWYLGIRTIALMRRTPPLETSAKVKVPRSTVRRALAWALPVAFSNSALRALR